MVSRLKPSTPLARRKWLVAYSVPNGVGRIFMTSDDVEVSQRLVEGFEKYLHETGYPSALITNIVPLERFVDDPMKARTN